MRKTPYEAYHIFKDGFEFVINLFESFIYLAAEVLHLFAQSPIAIDKKTNLGIEMLDHNALTTQLVAMTVDFSVRKSTFSVRLWTSLLAQ